MQTMVARLNHCLSSQLAQLCVSFSARFDDDFALLATSKSGVETSATRLSGGQLCALAIATRLALYEFVRCRLPLLVLDEPTAWLDTDRVDNLVELMKGWKTHLEKSIYLCTVTHETALLPAFTQVVTV
jgi:DNA repair exonuclease SbcCD ATPase subunit